MNYVAVHKRRRQLGGRAGSKIGQNCRWRVLKKLPTWGRGVKNLEKLSTQFMEGPYYFPKKSVPGRRNGY